MRRVSGHRLLPSTPAFARCPKASSRSMLASHSLVPPSDRLSCVAGDLFDVTVPRHGLALLANVLHLYDAVDGARLVARAAALADAVVVKDLWVEAAGAGPPGALYFALNMALFTDGGEVHPAARIAGWLRVAGLGEPTIDRLGDDVIVWARR